MSFIQLKYRYNWTLVILYFFFIIVGIMLLAAAAVTYFHIPYLASLSGDVISIQALLLFMTTNAGFNIFLGVLFIIVGVILLIERIRSRRFQIY
ncbi:MAG: hypothetical protein ACTSRW_13865 [Candidatus Helarchaeota archaeon]